MRWRSRNGCALLFYIALVGSVTSSIYCLMVIAAAVRFGIRKRRDERTPPDFLPPVSVLKPLHGTEPGMERNLETFFEQQYPGDFELLFCARHETDQGLQLARKVGARYPHVHAEYLTCGEPMPKFHNAKVYSLEKLDSVAQTRSAHHQRCRRARRARLPAAHGAESARIPTSALPPACISARPTAAKSASFASKLDAVGKSVEMTSGVLVADMLEGTTFALGATMATRKQSFRGGRRLRRAGPVLRRRLRARQPAGEAGNGRQDGDPYHPADGAGHALLALVPQPVALDAEHTPFASVGTSRNGAHVRHAVRVAGADLGPCAPAPARWACFGCWPWRRTAGCRRRPSCACWATRDSRGTSPSTRCATCWAASCGCGSYGGDKFYYRGKHLHAQTRRQGGSAGVAGLLAVREHGLAARCGDGMHWPKALRSEVRLAGTYVSRKTRCGPPQSRRRLASVSKMGGASGQKLPNHGPLMRPFTRCTG